MSRPSAQEELVKLYQETAKELSEKCIIEEIKNNNTVALDNYSSLIQKLNNRVSSLQSQNTLTPSERLIMSKIQETKTKALTRKAALEQRVVKQESYTISRHADFSSYSAFASAFRQPSQSQTLPSPTLPSSSGDFKVPTIRTVSGPAAILETKKNEVTKVRKSLDQPRPRSSAEYAKNYHQVRSKSPAIRKERPKSVDLSINQAAILAWDQNQAQNQKKYPSRPTSPVAPSQQQRSISSSRYQSQSKPRKYHYVQPTINTQINLTHIPRGRPNAVRVSSSPQSEKPLLTVNSPTAQQQQKEKPKKALKYKDKRIIDMMDNLQGVDEEACNQILNEIMITDEHLTWDDIAGLESAKRSLKETVVYPFLRPDLFKGLREPISGMLLFGPPGTGKTMIAKTVANESSSTFFSISASSLLSKYLGESEKLIRALFYIAKKLSPSIIFFDEVDSLLTARGDGEHETSRRVKTEFLIQWSSLVSATSHNEKDIPRVLVLAATNLPWSIDEAARRRFSRRLYIPLPEFDTRLIHLKRLLRNSPNTLTDSDFIVIANLTEGYSSSDITSLAKEAAMEPIRDIGENLINIENQEIRGVSLSDFEIAMQTIKRSVGEEDLKKFEVWAAKFGSSGS